MFFRIKVEQKHAEKFRFVKNLASCFQMCYSKCKGTTAHKVVALPVWQKPTCIRSRLQGRLIYFRLLFLSIQVKPPGGWLRSAIRKLPPKNIRLNISYVLIAPPPFFCESQGGFPPCNTIVPCRKSYHSFLFKTIQYNL